MRREQHLSTPERDPARYSSSAADSSDRPSRRRPHHPTPSPKRSSQSRVVVIYANQLTRSAARCLLRDDTGARQSGGRQQHLHLDKGDTDADSRRVLNPTQKENDGDIQTVLQHRDRFPIRRDEKRLFQPSALRPRDERILRFPLRCSPSSRR